jgi:hypothetical protein
VDVANERHPVKLDQFPRLFGGLERRSRNLRELMAVATNQVVGKPGLRAVEFHRTAVGHGFKSREVGVRERGAELAPRIRVGAAEGIVGKPLRVVEGSVGTRRLIPVVGLDRHAGLELEIRAVAPHLPSRIAAGFEPGQRQCRRVRTPQPVNVAPLATTAAPAPTVPKKLRRFTPSFAPCLRVTEHLHVSLCIGHAGFMLKTEAMNRRAAVPLKRNGTPFPLERIFAV